jgi:hypothetical protein
VSIGAVLAVPEDTAESLVARADELLYQSKTNGRNRVTSSGATPTATQSEKEPPHERQDSLR